MSVENLDEIIASGDGEAIEAAFDDMEITGDLLFGDDNQEDESLEPEKEEQGEEQNTDDAPAEEEQKQEEAVADSNENDVADDADKTADEVTDSSPAEDEAKAGVIEQDGKLYVEITGDNAEIDSKNGKHRVPYDVLSKAREEVSSTKAKLEEQEKVNAELQSTLDENKRVSELYAKQLADAGIDKKLLPEQLLKDPELLSKLKEGQLDTDEVIAAIAHSISAESTEQQEATQTSEPESTPESDSFQDAFNNTKHLKGWLESDADRWSFAQVVDDKLANDPLFANKTPSERLAEVEKRVMAAFGDELPADDAAEQKPPAQQAPAPAAQKQAAPIPDTPSDVGHQGSDLNLNAQLLEKGAAEISAQMESMTDAQIEALLEQSSDFL